MCHPRDSSCPSLQDGGRTFVFTPWVSSNRSNSSLVFLSDTSFTALFWRGTQGMLPSQKDACGPSTIQGDYSPSTSSKTCYHEKRRWREAENTDWLFFSRSELLNGSYHALHIAVFLRLALSAGREPIHVLEDAPRAEVPEWLLMELFFSFKLFVVRVFYRKRVNMAQLIMNGTAEFPPFGRIKDQRSRSSRDEAHCGKNTFLIRLSSFYAG